MLLLCVGLLATGCGSSSAEEDAEENAGRTTIIAGSPTEPKMPPFPKGKPPKDLVVKELRPGWGVKAREGDLLTTQFVAVKIDGEPFESTWDFEPFAFHLGRFEASLGFEEGLKGMQVGERRQLIVPGELASRYTVLPHEESFVYVVELIGVRPPELDRRQEPDVAVPPGKPPEELEVRDLIEGSGPVAKPGDTLTMKYVSRRYSGKPFSNSWDDPRPFRVQLGAESFKSIPAWEEGLPGMKVGGRREIIVPPELAFQGGAPPDSKPSDTLVYIVDLVGITDPEEQARAGA